MQIMWLNENQITLKLLLILMDKSNHMIKCYFLEVSTKIQENERNHADSPELGKESRTD